jgi:uncharacterized protein
VKPVLAAVLAAVLALALALAGAGALAQAPVPPLKARVTDTTGTLSAAQVQALETRLAEFEQRKGSQIAVLMVPTVQPGSIEEYSIRVADAWKIGRGRVDDGVIVVVAKNDRKVRIEVGRGLEGAIPDIIASRVIREIVTPRFRAGDFYGGLSEATQALMQRIEGEPLPEPKAQARAQGVGDSGTTPFFFFLLLPVLFVLGGGLARAVGRGPGAVLNGGIVGGVAWWVAGMGAAIFLGILAFLVTLLMGAGVLSSARRGWGSGGWGGGGWGGGGWGGGGWGGGGGGGFGGGGGGFSGGGASGSW